MKLLAALATVTLALAPQQTRVQRDAEELLARYERCGWSGSALVAKDGKLLFAHGYGLADADAKRPCDERTLFEIASITKQFTAAAILKLEEQGKLSTDDPIEKHLPGVPEHSRAITIHQLLSHTSGVPGTNGRGSGEDLERAVVDFLGEGPTRKPGTTWEYWNGGYSLLAGIVERASQRSFTQYCEEELFAPAEMRDTGFTGDTDLDAQRASIGISTSGAPRSALEHPYGSYGWQYRGMGGAVTTVLDLFAWDRALAGDTVLSEKSRAKLFRPVEHDYAYGWFVTEAKDKSERQSHGGGVRGFASELRRYPKHDACVIVLSNLDGVPVWAIAENLECILLGRPLSQREPPAGVDVAPEELARFAGTYSCPDGRVVASVTDGALTVGLEGQEVLDAAGLASPPWPVIPSELAQEALAIVVAITQGNVEPLRKRMAPRIPPGWPDQVRDELWPAHVSEHGKLKSMRALGALTRGNRMHVVLALEHEQGPSRVLVAFSRDGLEILDWSGPEFPASARLVPSGADAFEDFRWVASQRYEFKHKGKQITGLAIEDLKLTKE